jgi:ADP-ribose pyrophosphatase
LSTEVTLSSERLYEGRVVNLRLDTVRLDDGTVTKREIVEHGEAVAIVPIDGAGHVLLVRQYRKPIEQELLEIPAGGVDPGEDATACAERELQEETGYRAGRLQRLGGFFSSPGFTSEYLHVYLATDLVPSTGAQPCAPTADDDEAIELVRLSVAQALDMIASGEICDAKTIIGLLLLQFKSEELAPQVRTL